MLLGRLRYIDVYEYPDGRLELRADGARLDFARFDKLAQIETAAIVENKRLGYALQTAKLMQEQRDDRRGFHAPSRTNQGQPPYPTKLVPGRKPTKQLTPSDLNRAILQASQRRSRGPTLPT